jgi:hypothetical protein
MIAGAAALALVAGGAFGAPPRDTARLPFVSPIFGDSIVFQRCEPSPVWG